MRNLTATLCLTIATLLTSATVENANAAQQKAELERQRGVGSATTSNQSSKIPIWANHQSKLFDEYNNPLSIRYSKDGKTFSVVW
jgi:hypothetical protein